MRERGTLAAGWSRREILQRSALGFGSLAFAALNAKASSAENPLAAKQPHFRPRAKRVILLFLEGGLSHVDTIDYKPELIRRRDQPMPLSATPKKIREGKGEPFEAFGSLLGPVAEFRPRGDSGLWISDAFRETAAHADDLCILNGMVADSTEHGTATQQFHTGLPVLPRPSMGAWILYGLGTENESLPGFVVVSPPAGSNVNCGADFLPGVYQSTILRDAHRADGEKIRYLAGAGMSGASRGRQLEFLQRLNRRHAEAAGGDPELESLIEANELAFRMQTEAAPALDLDQESAATQRLYGIGEQQTDAFARQCLLARRLAERGVRFIQVTSKGWDHHDYITTALPESCSQVDRPIAGLLADLKSRGLLDDTLIVISGEFGRTPVFQNKKLQKDVAGRGHNPFGWSLMLAGGGVKPGLRYGATDDFGYSAVEGRVHIHDLHATILHLLGLDHERLTFRHGGRDYRLTDVAGRVAREIVA